MNVCLENILYDDECTREALESLISLYERFIEEHKKDGYNETSSEIELNREMVKRLKSSLEQVNKIIKYF